MRAIFFNLICLIVTLSWTFQSSASISSGDASNPSVRVIEHCHSAAGTYFHREKATQVALDVVLKDGGLIGILKMKDSEFGILRFTLEKTSSHGSGWSYASVAKYDLDGAVTYKNHLNIDVFLTDVEPNSPYGKKAHIHYIDSVGTSHLVDNLVCTNPTQMAF